MFNLDLCLFHLLISTLCSQISPMLLSYLTYIIHTCAHSECIGQRSPLGILFWYYFLEIGSLTDPLNLYRLSGQQALGILLCLSPQHQNCISYRMHHHTRNFTWVLWIITGPHVCAAHTSETRSPPLHPNCIFDLRCLQYRIEPLSTAPLQAEMHLFLYLSLSRRCIYA